MGLTRFYPAPSDRMAIIWSLMPISDAGNNQTAAKRRKKHLLHFRCVGGVIQNKERRVGDKKPPARGV